MTRATINTDASWCPQTRSGGWAVWISIDGGVKVKRSGIFKARARDAQHAEQMACMNGLWLAAGRGVSHALVQTDCLALVQTSGRGHGSKQNNEFMAARDEHWPNMHVRWKHVKAHAKRITTARQWVNDWCDREAKAHMREQRKQTSRQKKKA